MLRRLKAPTTPVAFARAVGRADETLTLTTLGEADASLVDMATLVIIGSSETRFIAARRRAAMDADAARLWSLGDERRSRP